jgi:glucosamine-6-phosphate deaminase
MQVHVSKTSAEATLAAADALARVISAVPNGRSVNVMIAGGNTPLPLYAEIAQRRLDMDDVSIFALDEYVGVPVEDPRTCANLIRRTVIEAWGIPESRFASLDSTHAGAAESIRRHEERISRAGGLDVVILGLGRNGHIGFNEPGSDPDSIGRVLSLEAPSIEANRIWFGGEYAPSAGVTTGMRTLLAARSILLLAFGEAKARAVESMLAPEPSLGCPASWLARHPNASVFLDEAAAVRIPHSTASGPGSPQAVRRDGKRSDG